MARGALRKVWVVFAAAAIALGACTSPTLPLPPPALPSVVGTNEPSTFLLRSDRGALPNALVIAVNRNESLPANRRVAGTFADAAGSYELSVFGTSGDVVDVSQESDNTRSASVSITLK